MEPIIELYHNDLSSCAQKVRIALYEKQLPWKSHHLNLRKGDQFKPEYMKLNPNGVVPTLVHGDRVVIESNVILEYIEDTFPEPSLSPSDPADLEAMRLWLRRLDRSDAHPSELQSLMRHSYAVFCLKTKNPIHQAIS